MKKIGLAVFIILMILAVAGCGEKSGLEGKVLDAKGQPIAHVKIIAKQVQPIKGYEQFEATTSADGSFSFKKLFPTSEYILFPWYEDWGEAPMRTLKYETNKLVARFNKEGWTTEQKMKAQSGPDGQTIILKSPLIIQPTVAVIEGKVVDGKKQPLASIKVFATQKKLVPGYERFEAVTGADGTFRFAKLFPYSKYAIIPSGKTWTTNAKTVVTAKGEQEVLTVKISVRLTKANGVVHDSATGLMWATHDNGKSITWPDAKAYCAKYKSGGFSDWRLPTYAELKSLYKAGIRYKSRDIINISTCCLWATEARGSTVRVSGFNFYDDDPLWRNRTWSSGHYRALPIRDADSLDSKVELKSNITIKFTSRKTGKIYERNLSENKQYILPEGMGKFVIKEFKKSFTTFGRNLGETYIGTLIKDNEDPINIILPLDFPTFDNMRKGDFIISISANY